MRPINAHDIADISIGAAILGSGGGGNPYMGRLIAERAIAKYGPVSVVSGEKIADDARIIAIAVMGAPTVFQEKILSGTESIRAISEIVGTSEDRPTYLVNPEIGGVNATTAIAPAAQLKIPLIDGDLISRAFPEIHMILPNVVGVSPTPLILADEKGNITKINAISYAWGERFCRSLVMAIGGTAVLAFSILYKDLKSAIAYGTLNKARLIGQSVRNARQALHDPGESVVAVLGGKKLYAGKIIDVERKLVGGFIRGSILIEGEGIYAEKPMKIDFQNEYLVAYLDAVPIVTTPDLICVIETSTGEALPADVIRYSSRVTVITATADKRWCTQEGLKIAGPQYFGYDFGYKSIINNKS